MPRKVLEGFRDSIDVEDKPVRKGKNLLESCVDVHVYKAKLAMLSGVPSAFALDLLSQWKAKKPVDSDFEDYSDFCSANREYIAVMSQDVIEKLHHYYFPTDKNNERLVDTGFYNPGTNTYAIKAEILSNGSSHIMGFTNLSYEEFKNIYRDIIAFGIYLIAIVNVNPDKQYHFTNMSLGELRYTELCSLGIENKAALEAEARSMGFDEDKYKAKYAEELGLQ